jgi:hypothetical protein
MSSIVRITSGSYRKDTIKGEVFTLVKGYQLGSKGGFVTVKNEGQFPGRGPQVRVNVDSQSMIEFVSGRDSVKAETPKETETEAMDRIASRFAVLDEMSKACISGEIRAMIVTGPAGIGKSWLLINIGANAVKAGKTVIHYTLELNENYVGQRYYSVLSGINAQTLKHHQ